MKFTLTYEVVTSESAEQGDCARSGWMDSGGFEVENPEPMSLRHALDQIDNHRQNGVEADSCPVTSANPPRWFTACGIVDMDGEVTSVSMHLPRSITGASAMRIARLVGCYGLRR